MKCNNLSQALAEAVNERGKAILLDNTLNALLADYLPDGKLERNILKQAFQLGIPAKLHAACGKPAQDQQIVMSRCVSQLADVGMAESASTAHLQVYAEALGWEKRLQAAPIPEPPKPAPTPMIQQATPKPDNRPLTKNEAEAFTSVKEGLAPYFEGNIASVTLDDSFLELLGGDEESVELVDMQIRDVLQRKYGETLGRFFDDCCIITGSDTRTVGETVRRVAHFMSTGENLPENKPEPNPKPEAPVIKTGTHKFSRNSKEFAPYPHNAPEMGNIPQSAFVLRVEKVVFIQGRGACVYGLVERGTIKMQDMVEISSCESNRKAVVTGIYTPDDITLELDKDQDGNDVWVGDFAKGSLKTTVLESAGKGEWVCVLLRGINYNDIHRGDLIHTG